MVSLAMREATFALEEAPDQPRAKPAAAFAIREAMNDVEEAPGKVWFWELERAVIDANRCVQCGVCIAACPSDSIGIGPDDLPKLVKMCTGCSLCWDFCPRGGLRYEAVPRLASDQTGHVAPLRLVPSSPVAADQPAPVEAAQVWKLNGGTPRRDGLGAARQRYTARVRQTIPGAQDGGVASALLIALLEGGELDGALLARQSETEPWKGVAYLARTPDEVAACAGSFYNQTLALGHLDLKRYDLPPHPRIAVVGTPCEIQGLRAMQARPWSWGASRVNAVVLTIALLCTKSFNYEQLMVREIQAKRGIPLSEVGKVDILHGKLLVYDRQGAVQIEEPVRDFHGAALKGCDECADFLGHSADISVGSVGSADGYSSVLLWTDTGETAFNQTRDRLEIRDLDRPQAIEKLDAMDKKVAFETLKRPYDPDAPLFIDYEEHLNHYAETDRAPVAHEPFRY